MLKRLLRNEQAVAVVEFAMVLPVLMAGVMTKRVAALATALGAKPPTETRCPCWTFKTDVLPMVPATMPATVKELFGWLQAWDRATGD